MPPIPYLRSFPNPLGDYPRKSRASLGVFPVFLMILPGLLAAGISLILANSPIPETPRNRQIILDVPERSSVNAQVTSENNTINLQNL